LDILGTHSSLDARVHAVNVAFYAAYTGKNSRGMVSAREMIKGN